MGNGKLPVGEMRMLPHACKKWGFIAAAAVLVAMIVVASVAENKPPVEYFWSPILVALLVAAVSREKREDETVRKIRLASCFSSFVFIVLFVAVSPLFPLISGTDYEPYSAHKAVFCLLLFYHFMFYTNLRRFSSK